MLACSSDKQPDAGGGGTGGASATAASGGASTTTATGGASSTGGSSVGGSSATASGAPNSMTTGAPSGGSSAGGATSGGGTGGDTCVGAAGANSEPRVLPPSCDGLPETCGVCQNENCCASSLVPGGSYLRSYDGGEYSEDTWPATVSDFRLDKFEVTVGRFRPFLAAYLGGWRPEVGSGTHSHLNDGAGVNGNEAGWLEEYEDWIPDTLADWEEDFLFCDAELQSWSSEPGAKENHAVNCVSWFQAYAFCIWDGGFLPTEAEWNYAAAGGDEQREYPWGAAEPTPELAVYYCRSGGTEGCDWQVGSRPAGNGRWGQSDLAGNRWEWVLDTAGSDIDWPRCGAGEPCTGYIYDDCDDCANLRDEYTHITRGGSNTDATKNLRAALRAGRSSYEPINDTGFRCARAP